MTFAGFRSSLTRPGALMVAWLSDGREATIYPLMTGTVRLTVGEPGAAIYDDAW